MNVLDRLRRRAPRPIRRHRSDIGVRSSTPRLRKEDALCCALRRDELGRLPVGFCSPGCVRRPKTAAAR